MKKLFNKKNGFILLMIISTFALAGSAAYYSVFGLSSLFAGAKTEVIIMAGALEFSKLILASYLHNHWSRAGWMKWYLTLAVGILMVITSAGIYGFLTSAYQSTADKLSTTDKLVEVVELKKGRFQEQLTYYNDEKNKLNQSINDLRSGLANNTQTRVDRNGNVITSTSSSQRKSLESQLNSAVQQRESISLKIEAMADSITKLDLEVLDLQTNNEVAAEVGPLRYMSEITGKPMNVIVNWFTLLIVFVFDPLAISMVIALNKLTNKENEDDGPKLDFGVASTIVDGSDDGVPVGDSNNEKTESEVSEPPRDVEEVRAGETTQTTKKAIQKESKVAKKQKEEVTFIPTDEDATNLYGESIKKLKPKTPPKHQYRN
jgi:hypothetical protein